MNQKEPLEPQERIWRTDKNLINRLVKKMNRGSLYPMQATDDLLYVFDAVITPEQINFMIQMGGGNHDVKSLVEKIDLPEEEIKRLLDSLVSKGPIAIIKDDAGNDCYHLMSIFPGWFEFYLMRGENNEETREFAERLESFIGAAAKMGISDMMNELMKNVEPFMNVLATSDLQVKTIEIDQEIEPSENIIFSTRRVLNIFEQLDENETITIGKCFCRFQKQLIGDVCRTEIPLDTCISIGPAAEHLMKQGIAKQINKEDAISRIKSFQEKGAIHQSTPTIPIKDFQAKYPYDRFCNCCWDCCTLIGAYNRAQMPYMLNAYHKAVIPDPELCTSCEECIPYCPTGAIIINSSGKAEINDELCIGCGQCYTHCPAGVFELVADERKIFLPMLKTSQARIKSDN